MRATLSDGDVKEVSKKDILSGCLIDYPTLLIYLHWTP